MPLPSEIARIALYGTPEAPIANPSKSGMLEAFQESDVTVDLITRMFSDTLSDAERVAAFNALGLGRVTALAVFIPQLELLCASIDEITDPADRQQLIDASVEIINSIGAGGITGIVNDIKTLQQRADRVDAVIPPAGPTVRRFQNFFAVRDDISGTVYDFTTDIADADTPFENLKIEIVSGDNSNDALPIGLSLFGAVLTADGTQQAFAQVLQFILRVTDESGNVAERPFSLEVIDAAAIPPVRAVFAAIPDVSFIKGSAISARDHTQDVLNINDLAQPVTVSASVEPVGSGVTFTGAVRGGVASDVVADTVYMVTVSVQDGLGVVDEFEYDITVSVEAPPVWQTLPSVSSVRGVGNYLFNLAPFVTAGADIDTVVSGAPAGTTLSNGVVSIPTGTLGQGTLTFGIIFSATNSSGVDVQSRPFTISLIDVSFTGGGGGGGFRLEF